MIEIYSYLVFFSNCRENSEDFLCKFLFKEAVVAVAYFGRRLIFPLLTHLNQVRIILRKTRINSTNYSTKTAKFCSEIFFTLLLLFRGFIFIFKFHCIKRLMT